VFLKPKKEVESMKIEIDIPDDIAQQLETFGITAQTICRSHDRYAAHNYANGNFA
jgi:hypothetical protein